MLITAFSLLHNWNLLGDGIHSVQAYADGVLFASTQVKVTTLGEEFVRGADFKGRFSFSRDTVQTARWMTSSHLSRLNGGKRLRIFVIVN